MNPLDPNNYNVDAVYIDDQLERIKKTYLEMKSSKGYGKQERIKNLNNAKKYAEKLYKLLPFLSIEQFDRGTDNTRGGLEFILPYFINDCLFAIPHQHGNPGIKDREITLLRNVLFGLFKQIYVGSESLGYKSKKKRKYVGAYPDFLEYILPYFNISIFKVQAFSKPLDTPLKNHK